MFTTQDALQAVINQAAGTAITEGDINQLLSNVKGVTFANVVQVTKVATSAANKGTDIRKFSKANVQLFNNLSAFTSAYSNAVKRTAALIATNDATNIAAFEPQETYFEHTACYSVVKHKVNGTAYLYAIYNNSESFFVIDGCIVDKATVAEYLTPSAARALLNPPATVTNVAHGIEHSVTIRTVKLDSLVAIKACKQELTV